MDQSLKDELVDLTEAWLSAAMRQDEDNANQIRSQITEKMADYPEELAKEQKEMDEAVFPQQYANSRIAYLVG